MNRKIFVNLAVADLPKSMEFFKGLGWTFNPHFTDETAACMVISDDIYAMLLTHKKFGEFTTKPLCDARQQTEVLVAITCESREEVDRFVDAGLAGGGTVASPAQDLGFMFHRSMHDLDGHVWEFVWMDPAAIPQG